MDVDEYIHTRTAISRIEGEIAERKLEVSVLSAEAAKRKEAVETAQLAQVGALAGAASTSERPSPLPPPRTAAAVLRGGAVPHTPRC